MRLYLAEHHFDLEPVAFTLLLQIHFRAVTDGKQIQHQRADGGSNGDIISVEKKKLRDNGCCRDSRKDGKRKNVSERKSLSEMCKQINRQNQGRRPHLYEKKKAVSHHGNVVVSDAVAEVRELGKNHCQHL